MLNILIVALLGLLVYLILVMDNPYSGQYSVGTEAFELVPERVINRKSGWIGWKILGRTPMIYTGPSFWNQTINSDFSKYPLWVAASVDLDVWISGR